MFNTLSLHDALPICALRLHFHGGDRGRTGSRTTDVECAHGQLGAGLADRLRRDDADRLADVDQMTAAEVAAVALCAPAIAVVAGDRRTHDHLRSEERR